MKDPVILGIDQSYFYEREALEDHIRQYGTNPVTHKHARLDMIRKVHLPLFKASPICTLHTFYQSIVNNDIRDLKKLHWLEDYATLALDQYVEAEQKGWTILHYVVAHQQKEILKELLEYTTDVDIADEKGLTPLHLAVLKNNVEAIKLLSKKSSLIKKDKQGKSALDYAIQLDRSATVVKLLMNKKLIHTQSDKTGWTLLHKMANEGHLEAVKALIELGANIETTDYHGKIPLHLAAGRGHVYLLDLLINPQTINAEDNDGWTALHWAISNTHSASDLGKNIEVIRYLVQKGANTDARDENDKSPIDFADATLRKAITEALNIPVVAWEQKHSKKLSDYGKRSVA